MVELTSMYMSCNFWCCRICKSTSETSKLLASLGQLRLEGLRLGGLLRLPPFASSSTDQLNKLGD